MKLNKIYPFLDFSFFRLQVEWLVFVVTRNFATRQKDIPQSIYILRISNILTPIIPRVTKDQETSPILPILHSCFDHTYFTELQKYNFLDASQLELVERIRNDERELSETKQKAIKAVELGQILTIFCCCKRRLTA